MNIESILEKSALFNDLVIESGLKRDITDYHQSIQPAQNRNLVFMKGLSNKLINSLSIVENNSLANELKIILKSTVPFTDSHSKEALEELDKNREVDANTYFTQFNQILTKLVQEITANENEINEIEKIFSNYITDTDSDTTDIQQALVSLIFKDLKSTGTLKEFSKVLNRWSRGLLVYHTLLKSESPNEISLVEIQNGSIDVILNLDVDIAIDLTDLIKVALQSYAAYLIYKSKTAKEIIASYLGNKKLISMEEEREKLMLENIKDSIKEKISEQHKSNLEQDNNIDKTAIAKRIEEVSSLIIDHIIKGNEIKLLSKIEDEKSKDSEDENEVPLDLRIELREASSIVRDRFKNLDQEDKQVLLEKYTLQD